MTHIPTVTNLKLKRKSCQLEVTFDDGVTHQLSCEFLRVHSPSAEVQGHGDPILVTHKKMVNITHIEMVGHYGVKLVFDDGHNTGIYSWSVLYHLATQYESLWQIYLSRMSEAKASREAIIPMVVQYRS
ncbi:DUF971 domain-containing protein [Parashewanella spongiae]|uniref:DUF971 domain-containing protein n=1 Tax=Parashewanella spongiae TaxID=342950 RepID=A0A3A6U2W9_9GAMM|nr:DUF971 domain-containing protein [Parashewanella spongiae]MCL1077426.1 DUF971 domain-containing protein [Parashewanella spongiae]RJY18357.1 DUF971 domain-containing protein [Parashewanella spongiae]